jgi:hypothetical protein
MACTLEQSPAHVRTPGLSLCDSGWVALQRSHVVYSGLFSAGAIHIEEEKEIRHEDHQLLLYIPVTHSTIETTSFFRSAHSIIILVAPTKRRDRLRGRDSRPSNPQIVSVR